MTAVEAAVEVSPAGTRDLLVSPDRLRAFFAPRGIALVGASETSTWTRNIIGSLTQTGRPGPLVAVHPRHTAVRGLPTYPSLREVPEPIDLAWVLTSPPAVPAILADAAAAGVTNVVVLASGYREIGDEGRDLQLELTERAVHHGITLLGPNCMGFVNPWVGASPLATTVPFAPVAGGLGVVTQSGALAGGILEFAYRRGIGLSLLASMGNEAVITTPDVINYLAADDHTRAIALFLEGFGDARAFRRAVENAHEAGKPVVALKVGRTEEAQRAAMAHTGALGGDDAIADAALRQFGVTRVDSLEELLSTAGLLAHLPTLPAGNRVAIVTASGGAADVIVDRAIQEGLSIPPFGPATRDAIAPLLSPFAHLANPLDVTGFQSAGLQSGPTKTVDEAVAIVARDPDVDVVFNAVLLPKEIIAGSTAAQDRIRALGAIVRDAPVPVVTCSYLATDLSDYQRVAFAEHGLHHLGGIDLAMTALGHAVRWSAARRVRPAAPPVDELTPLSVSASGVWAEDDARDLLAGAGFPVVPARLANTADGAVAAAEEIGYPVVLKICSAQIAHKTEVGGVALDLRSAGAVRDAFAAMRTTVAERAPHAEVRGVLVAPMRRGGTELLMGVTVDATFGPVLTVALGGIWVEVLRDVVHRLLPVAEDDVRAMLAELRAFSLLHGARGTRAADVDRIVAAAAALSRCALALGDRLEVIEVNPLRVDGAQVEALDALVVTT